MSYLCNIVIILLSSKSCHYLINSGSYYFNTQLDFCHLLLTPHKDSVLHPYSLKDWNPTYSLKDKIPAFPLCCLWILTIMTTSIPFGICCFLSVSCNKKNALSVIVITGINFLEFLQMLFNYSISIYVIWSSTDAVL